MKNISKWIVIVWSVICLVGIISGTINVLREFGLDKEISGVEVFAIGTGLFIWLIIWAVIAGPTLAIYFLSEKSVNKITKKSNVSWNSCSVSLKRLIILFFIVIGIFGVKAILFSMF